MKYEQTYRGRIYQLQSGELYTLRPDGKFAYAGASTSAIAQATLTGYYRTSSSGATMWLTVGDTYIDLADGWQYVGDYTLPVKTQKEAQKIVDTILRNNKTIICNNILCARFANRLTKAQREQLYELQTRLEARNNALKADGLVTDVVENYPEGYVYLRNYLDSFMSNPDAVGSLTVSIIIAAVVIASLSTAAYFAYKYYADESEKDVQFSKELTKTLTAKLTEEEYQQLLQETKGIVTKAKIKQQLSSVGNVAKWIGIAAGAVGVYLFAKGLWSNE